jgi:hypothetical protein
LVIEKPELLFVEGKCESIGDDYEYALCGAEQIEALILDRKTLLPIVEGCIK